MGLRFFRRLRLFPGVSLNVSGSGISMSLGPRGAHYTVGPRGSRVSVGIPGTGLYYSQRVGGGATSGRATAAPPAPEPEPPAVDSRLEPGFFEGLLMGGDEMQFLAGIKALHEGDEAGALTALAAAAEDVPDAALAGAVVAFTSGNDGQAAELARRALAGGARLGEAFGKRGIAFDVTLRVTPDCQAHVGPDERSAMLVLVEALQSAGHVDEAIEAARRWLALDESDPVARLSLCELLVDRRESTPAELDGVVRMCEGARAEGDVRRALDHQRDAARARLGY